MPLQDTTPQVILISDETNAVGLAVSGAIPANTPGILMAGVVNNNSASFLKLDSGGNLFITGSVTSQVSVTATNPSVGLTGSAVPVSASYIAGVDNAGLLRGLSVTSAGALNVTGSQFVFNNSTSPLYVATSGSSPLTTTQFEPPTFMVTAETIQIGNNKSMISLLNGVGSTVFVKIKTITISNVQTATVVGILAQMRLHRISAHSIGTSLTPQSFDSGDSLNVAVTARTGATVTEGVFYKKQLLQTNEINGAGGTGSDTTVALLETQMPFFSEANDSKAIILRANEGIHIRQATNSTVGTFDLTIVFTVETSV